MAFAGQRFIDMHDKKVDVATHLGTFYRQIAVALFWTQRSYRDLIRSNIQILGVQRDIFGAFDHIDLERLSTSTSLCVVES